MGLRHRSIQLRVGVLIILPVLCLIGLSAFAVSITLGNALSESHAKTLRDTLLAPLADFQQKLASEQRLAVLSLATPGSADLASKLSQAENETRLALGSLTQTLASPAVKSEAQPHVQQAISALLADTQKLSYIRNVVDASAITIPNALQAYGTITSQGYQVLAAAGLQESDVSLATQTSQLINLDQAAQTTLEESDLITADIARAKFPTEDRVLFGQLAGNRSQLVAATLPLLDRQYQQLVSASVPAATSSQLASLEATIEATPWRSGTAPSGISGGLGVFGNYSSALGKATARATTVLQKQAQTRANSGFTELILAVGLGLLGTIASVALSLVIGRRLVRQLRGLRESALSLANDRLPTVIRQLRDGQAVDLADYEVPVHAGTKDEIEQVQHAFNVVQQTAVKSAIDEARLRRGISDVFRNLAGRSQSLLHRQLTLLDGMERRATEPEELEDLFRIDHLTTRMRRHAEGLIILSGETPARGWRQPVPLIDVLRAAVAEVEDYTRIRVLARTRSAVAGHAVADVIHLVAELAENATVFSPPNTPVRIQGDIVGKGFAIEIEDRGLGISPDRLVEINRDLADPPQFDLSDSDRLGLFIAGQLARRHDISITLQPSVYGGTTAIVVIPMALVVDEGAYAPDPALPAGSTTAQAGRHAALSGAERGRLTAGNGYALSLVPDAAASLPSGTIASAEAVAAADDAFSPVAFVDPGTFGPAEPTPAGEPAASPLPGPAALPIRTPPSGPAPADQPPASLPGRGHRIGERAWQLTVPAQPGPAETAPFEAVPGEPGPADTKPASPEPAAASPAGAEPDEDQDPPRRPADGAITDVFAARRAGAEAGTAAPAGHSESGSLQAGGDRTESRISTEELAELGLPVRVRQASLAPQLRDSKPAEVQPPAPPPAEPEAGSPEAARSTMSALQRGWQLGRAEAGGWPATAENPPADAASTADDEPPPADGDDERATD